MSPESSDLHVEKLLSLWRGSGSDDYTTVKEELMALRSFVQDEIARRFTPVLNKELQQRPQQTLAEKQDLAHFANAAMRSLFVSAKEEHTGQAGVLRASSGNRPETGRFQLELIGPPAKPRQWKHSTQLFTLELMATPAFERGYTRGR